MTFCSDGRDALLPKLRDQLRGGLMDRRTFIRFAALLPNITPLTGVGRPFVEAYAQPSLDAVDEVPDARRHDVALVSGLCGRTS